VDLERGVKSKDCDNPESKSSRKKARKLLDDKTGKIHRIKRKEKRPQKRAHQFFRKNTKHAAQMTDNPRSNQKIILFRDFADFRFSIRSCSRIYDQEERRESFAKQFRGTFLGRIYKENFHNWAEIWAVLFGASFKEFVLRCTKQGLLVDEKWH